VSVENRAAEVRRAVLILVLFGIVFGYVEAAAVVYIRSVYEPIHVRRYPDRERDDLFPLLTLEDWAKEGPPIAAPLMEVGRELGTLLVVALLAWALSREVRTWFASFALTFGVWDITYYAWLALLTGWPRSLCDWDLIFAAPVPWVGPVWAPMSVALTMTVTAAVFFWREGTDRPMRPGPVHWAAVLIGAGMILLAFWWDWRAMLAGRAPEGFNWPLLVAGLGVGIGGFVHCWATQTPSPQPLSPEAGERGF
jgi:hypothetical protein